MTTKPDTITLADIRKAMKLIQEEYPEKLIFEDDYQKIYGDMLGPTTIQLKPKAVALVRGFYDNY